MRNMEMLEKYSLFGCPSFHNGLNWPVNELTSAIQLSIVFISYILCKMLIRAKTYYYFSNLLYESKN